MEKNQVDPAVPIEAVPYAHEGGVDFIPPSLIPSDAPVSDDRACFQEEFHGREPCFQEDLKNLINRHNMESGSNTPDFILAEYLTRCLTIFEATTEERTHWYGLAHEDVDDMKAIRAKPNCCGGCVPPPTVGDIIKETGVNQVVKTLNEGDLTDEEWREYDIPGRDMPYRINHPVTLYTRLDGTTHRILDATGRVHCVPFGGNSGVVLRWKSKPDCDPCAF